MSDFGALPPEINSARMYAGPGSGPLLASAAAWDGLAAELDTFGAGYSAAVSALQGQSWSGAASTAMAAAAAPYVAWVMTTAGQAGQAAGQARAAAAAYEAAFVATVPPAEVIANRVLLATLVATNFFGQNTPAIAATEAVYAEMWAQDAVAMYGYAVSASAAATLTAFDQPPQTANPAGQSTQSAAVGQAVDTSLGHAQTTLSPLMSAVPQQLQTLASGGLTNPSATSTPMLIGVTEFDVLLRSTILGFEVPKTTFQGGSYFLAAQRTRTQDSDLPGRPPAPQGAAATAQTWSPPEPSEPVLASTGRSTPVSGMSVPQNWTAATPATGPATEPVAAKDQGFRVLPPWVGDQTTTSAGIPTAGRIPAPTGRRQTNAVFRMRDRRYRIPRPPLGG